MTPSLFGVLALTFITSQAVAWRVFRYRGQTIGSTLKWSAIASFAGFVTTIAIFFAIVAINTLFGLQLGIGS